MRTTTFWSCDDACDEARQVLTDRCWKSHALMIFVATFGKIPRFLFLFLLPEPSKSKSSPPSPEPILASETQKQALSIKHNRVCHGNCRRTSTHHRQGTCRRTIDTYKRGCLQDKIVIYLNYLCIFSAPCNHYFVDDSWIRSWLKCAALNHVLLYFK